MKECMILQDLFPLYREGLLQEETVSILEEHFLECKKCKVQYEKYCAEKLLAETEEKKTESEKDILILTKSWLRS